MSGHVRAEVRSCLVRCQVMSGQRSGQGQRSGHVRSEVRLGERADQGLGQGVTRDGQDRSWSGWGGQILERS